MAADLFVPYTRVQGREEAFRAVEQAPLKELMAGYKIAADIHYDKSSWRISVDDDKFSLELTMEEDGARGELRLSLLLRPLRKTVLKILREELEKVL